MQEGSPKRLRVPNLINKALRADPGYMHLHHDTMRPSWHHYIQCTSM